MRTQLPYDKKRETPYDGDLAHRNTKSIPIKKSMLDLPITIKLLNSNYLGEGNKDFGISETTRISNWKGPKPDQRLQLVGLNRPMSN